MKQMTILTLLASILCTGCTLFNKSSATNEIEEMTKEVISEDRGFELTVKPLAKG